MLPKVAFILPDMGGGGAERLTVDLLRGFQGRGAAVDLVLMRNEGVFLPMVPKGVNTVDLGARRIRDVPRRLRRYFTENRLDAALATMWPLTSATILAGVALSNRPRIVVCEQCSLTEQYRRGNGISAELRLSVAASYRFADQVIAASRGLADETARLARVADSAVQTIYNPIPPPLRSNLASDPWAKAHGKRILGIGRLNSQKNFPLLLQAFALVASEIDATLAIVGEGSEREALTRLARELGIAERVLMPGFTTTPGDWYANADLFVLSSDYEGFGNVVVEAMHCGLPVVSTDCPHGPAEILGDGRWGTLVAVGDVALLGNAIVAVLSSRRDRTAQKARAAEFSVDRAVDAYWKAMLGDQAAVHSEA